MGNKRSKVKKPKQKTGKKVEHKPHADFDDLGAPSPIGKRKKGK